MIRLDAATVLLQWAAGGLLFLWVTTRRREVSLGYGWLMRGTYATIAIGGAYVGFRVIDTVLVRDLASVGVALAALAALAVSILRKDAGVSGQRELVEARSSRVAAMTGIERTAAAKDETAKEFPPGLDLIAPIIGTIGIIGAGVVDGSPVWLAVARLLVGAAFLGA